MRIDGGPSRLLRTAAALTLVVALPGCMSLGPGAEVKVVYYQLEADLEPGEGEPLPFAASDALEREGVRYRSSDVEGGYWSDDRWAEPVPSMVRGLLQRELEVAGMFRRVHLLEGAGFADLLVAGEVHRLGEEDRGADWYAVVELTVEVSRSTDGTVLFHRRYREEEPCADRTVREVVRALNRGTSRILAGLRGDLYRSLKGGGG